MGFLLASLHGLCLSIDTGFAGIYFTPRRPCYIVVPAMVILSTLPVCFRCQLQFISFMGRWIRDIELRVTMALGTSPLSKMRLLTMRLALPACRSHRQRTDAVVFIRRVGFGLLQLVDGCVLVSVSWHSWRYGRSSSM